MLETTFRHGYSSYFLILLIFVSILFLAGGSRELWKPDAPMVAGVFAEMYYSQDYTLPKLNGRPFLEAPPSYYWASVTAYNILWFIGFVIFIAEAILSKGILGVGVPGIAIFFWLLYDLII